MVVYVNIKGSNASRKSTKIDCLLKYLLHKGAIEEKVEGGFLLSYNNKKYYFFGKKKNNGAFVGIDSNPIYPKNSIRERHEHFGKIIKDYQVDYIFTEGYFNNIGSEQEKMEFLIPYGITERHFYYQAFKTLEETLESQKNRKLINTDKKQTIKFFNKIDKMLKKFKDYNEPNTITEKVFSTEDNDYYVQKYFNDRFLEYELPKSIKEINEIEKPKLDLDEW